MKGLPGKRGNVVNNAAAPDYFCYHYRTIFFTRCKLNASR